MMNLSIFARIKDSISRNPNATISSSQMSRIGSETNLLLLLLGDPVPVAFADMFPKREKLAVELGWKARKPNDIWDLVSHLKQEKKFANAIQKFIRFDTDKWWNLKLSDQLQYLIDERINLFGILKTSDNSIDQNLETTCPFALAKQRSLNGTCNRKSTRMGAAGERFTRFTPWDVTPKYDILTPNPRLVAKKLLHRVDNKVIVEDHVNLLAAAWIQFNIHDWFSHDNEPRTDEPIIVQSPEIGEGVMKVPRTNKDPTWNPKTGMPQTFVNGQSHWWDMSQLYGVDEYFTFSIRSLVGGKLKMTADNLIPINPATGTSFASNGQNWWTGLDLMFNLFSREHNAICNKLSKAYPKWSDEQLFQKAEIIRDRERGLPRCNDYRRVLGLEPFQNISQITDGAEIQTLLNQVYDNDIEKSWLEIWLNLIDLQPLAFLIRPLES
jgi:hypothetical protein